jgi:hypothetical protein
MPATNMQMDIGLVLLTAVEANVDGSGCGDLQPDPEAHPNQVAFLPLKLGSFAPRNMLSSLPVAPQCECHPTVESLYDLGGAVPTVAV